MRRLPRHLPRHSPQIVKEIAKNLTGISVYYIAVIQNPSLMKAWWQPVISLNLFQRISEITAMDISPIPLVKNIRGSLLERIATALNGISSRPGIIWSTFSCTARARAIVSWPIGGGHGKEAANKSDSAFDRRHYSCAPCRNNGTPIA
jgi:hypothetical protein